MARHQQAVMSILTAGAPLKPREGQFLGGIAFDANPLTEKQHNWLVILLDRYGLPPLAKGGDLRPELGQIRAQSPMRALRRWRTI